MKKLFAIILVLGLLLAGCSPAASPADDTAAAEPSGDNAEVSEQEQESGSMAADTPTLTPLPPTEEPSSEESPTEVVHWEFPGSFQIVPLQRIFDCVLGKQVLAGNPLELNTACDQWERNYFERPVDQELAEFYPQLDIVQSDFGSDGQWYYTRILLFAGLEDPLVLDGVYAVEIDLDLDARGDYLILSVSPGSYPADEWHSNGLQVWFDSNDDVGGPQAVLVDPRYDGDGYETLLVDSGIGEDPDLAYVKTYADQPGLVEFAFRASLLDSHDSFEWWVWAMAEDISAAKYDPVDFFPENTLFAMDNTCGWIFGSYLRDLPNICNVLTAPKPTSSASGTCKPGTPPIVDPCYKWDQYTCSWGWDFACIN